MSQKSMSFHEKRLASLGRMRIAGIDEAGRGPLAGPVFAAACILPQRANFRGLNDSKQLTPEEREKLFQKLMNTEGVLFGVGHATREEIDEINILRASLLSMQRAVLALPQVPDYLLIDGNIAPHFEIPHETIVSGDSLSISIAAASIIAKVLRDRHMVELDKQWPQYGFAQHKGYFTEKHQEALQKFGPCPEHRTSFQPVRDWEIHNSISLS